MIAPCTCGHSRDDHDFGYGTCANCECERFDEDSSFMECARDGLTFARMAACKAHHGAFGGPRLATYRASAALPSAAAACRN